MRLRFDCSDSTPWLHRHRRLARPRKGDLPRLLRPQPLLQPTPTQPRPRHSSAPFTGSCSLFLGKDVSVREVFEPPRTAAMASGDEHRTARPAGSISKNLTYSNVLATGSTAADQQSQDGSASGAAKKRKHRGGKKRRNRRQSFAAPADEPPTEDMTTERPSLLNAPSSSSRSNFYRLGQVNRSNTSLESEALLDHRYASRPTAAYPADTSLQCFYQ